MKEAHSYLSACISRLLHMTNTHIDWIWWNGRTLKYRLQEVISSVL